MIRLAVGICFPHMGKWIAETPDPRREHPSRKYELSLMMWTAMVMFVSQPGTRRQYDLDKGTTAFLLNVLALAGLPPDSASRLPTAEAVDDVLQKLDEDVFAKLRKRIVKALIRGKRIESCKFNGFWCLAVDATSIHTSSKRHCPHCQTKTCSKTKMTTYHHNVLEFKLVSPDGLAISLHSEFLVKQDGESKQDSEIKAFYRAAPEIKRMWPHMKFIIMGDAAYGNANFMRICKDNDWQYCVSLKDNLPTLRKAADAGLASAKPKLHAPEPGVAQRLRFVEGLSHGGFRTHAVECVETKPDKNGEMKDTRFLWMTSLLPSRWCVVDVADDVGRQRWKIENQGFNVQKNSGYRITHSYGSVGNAWRHYYLAAQVMHIIMQIATTTDALHKLPSRRAIKRPGAPKPLLKIFKSMKNFVKRLAEAFRFNPPTWMDIAELGPIQLRRLTL